MPKEIINRINELKQKISNREAVIIGYGDRVNPFKFKELKQWKKELEELENMLEQEELVKTEDLNNMENLTESESKENSEVKFEIFENPILESSLKPEEKIIEENEQENEEQDLSNEEKDFEENKELPQLDLNLNFKTGDCILKDLSNEDTYEMKIDSRNYTKKALKKQTEDLMEKFEISAEDSKYLKNVDSTIFNAYMMYDMNEKTSERYNKQASQMYINSVIDSSKKLENGEKINSEDVEMPGNVNIDLRINLKEKDLRSDEQKFKGISGIIAMQRAKKILKNHGDKKMNLANVLESKVLNRLKLVLGLGASATALIGAGAKIHNSFNANKTEFESQTEATNDSSENNYEKQEHKDKNIDKDNDVFDEQIEENEIEKQYQNDEIQLGSIVSPKKYSALYKSSDSKTPNGALGNVDKNFGINKIACVIDGKMFSTKDYSASEILKMAKKAGVDVRYHIDEATMINGKVCVQVREVGNSIPTYVYSDENGNLKYLDGSEFKGDVESGIGWIDAKDCKKSELKMQKKMVDNNKNIAKNEVER